MEAEDQVALGHGFGIEARYAHADARDLSTGLPLLRVPLDSAAASLTWRAARADAVLTVRAQSSAADVSGSIRPFAVADLAGSYALTPRLRLRLTARIENLTDVHYQQAFGYGEPGFGLFVGIRISG